MQKSISMSTNKGKIQRNYNDIFTEVKYNTHPLKKKQDAIKYKNLSLYLIQIQI